MIEIKLAMKKAYKSTEKANSKNSINSINQSITKKTLRNLPIGEGITYKELCDILGQKYYKGGNIKEKQLKEFFRYFDYEKIGNKFFIKEIYKEPKEVEYCYPANAIYAECIEKILLTYLSQQHDYITYISSQQLYWTLGMVTYEYIIMQRPGFDTRLQNDLKNKLMKDSQYEISDKQIKFYINDFYSRCKTKFSDIINTSLKSLQKRRLLEYQNVYHIIYEYIEEGKVISFDKYSNDSEIKDIITIEREVLDSYGYKSESDVWLHNKTVEYYDKITKRVKVFDPRVKSLYRCYKLIFNTNSIQKALTKDEEELKRRELNDKVLNFINQQTQRKYLSTISVRYGSDEFKYTKNYTLAQDYLSNRLIKLKS